MVSDVASKGQTDFSLPVACVLLGYDRSAAYVTCWAHLGGHAGRQTREIVDETARRPTFPRTPAKLGHSRRYKNASWSGTAAALKGRPPKARRRPPDSADATRKARAGNHQGGTTR